VILARLLTPADFGMVAAAYLVLAALRVLSQFGLNSVIVRAESLSKAEESTIFWLASGVAGLISLIGVVFGGWIAAAIGVPSAGPFVAVYALAGSISLMAGVPRALLQRRLQLGRMYAIDVCEMGIYSGLPIVLALQGAGAWSLVGGQAVSQAASLPMFLVAAKWVPSLSFKGTFILQQRTFTGQVFASSCLLYLARNADYWSVGRLFGPGQLGVYYIGYVLPNILRQRLTWASSEVLLPIFSRFSDDDERTRVGYLLSIRVHVFLGLPAMVGLATLSPQLIQLFFGPQWEAAATPMSIIALATIFDFIIAPGAALFLARGRPDRSIIVLLSRIFGLSIGLIVAIITRSLTWVAIAVLIGAIAALVANQRMIHNEIRPRRRSLVTAMAPTACSALLMSGVLFLAARSPIVDEYPVAAVAPLVLLGVTIFIAAALAIAPQSTRELIEEVLALSGLRKRASS
jgi:PST family polysaccharide transporter